ncbi:MAG: hypothetical protein PHF35_04955 [Candidatus Moranbacteria bacterium]|nr:hypothetical protein [Candidatus Moranbacteria bacterium]
MKKLNPFQKKLARWCERLPSSVFNIIVLWFTVLSMIMGVISSLCYLLIPGMAHMGLMIAAFLLFSYTFIVPILGFNAAQWRWRLPEICRKEAQKLMEKHSELSDILNPLIQESISKDDETGLMEKLRIINKLLLLKEKIISGRDNLIEISQKIAETEKQISALEKELGL